MMVGYVHRFIFTVLSHIAHSYGIPQALCAGAVFLPCVLSADVISVPPLAISMIATMIITTEVGNQRKIG